MIHDRLQAIQNYETCLKLTKSADYILLQFTDLSGLLKGRTIPSAEAKNALTEGVTFDGSSVLADVRIEESDMIMKPDADTFTVLPHYFYDKSVASFLCNIHQPDGTRYENDSRHICEKMIENASHQGYEPTAAAELEFYLVQKQADSTILPVENHVMDKQRYFDNTPGRDITESYRMDLTNALSTMGITVERQHHEVGSAQNEITFKYADPITTADNIIRYKFAGKAVANKKYSWIATFMPKPWQGKPGSGMHIHLGLSNAKTGKNPFYDEKGYASISQTCRYFIGGILEHARALSAIVASTINSYKRLVPGYEAPVYVAWSKTNRSALVRVPAFSHESEARIEFRCPDPLCNPYLAFAVVFEAGLDGIMKKIDPGDHVDANVYHLDETERKKLGVGILPTSLKEALEEWENDDICARVLGRANTEKFKELKLQECQEYETNSPQDKNEVTPWEVQKYLYS
jgi:glutamine synthetase